MRRLRKPRLTEGHRARLHLRDTTRADEQVGRQAEDGNAEQPEVACLFPDQGPHDFHRHQRIIRRQREQGAVRNLRRDRIGVIQEGSAVERKSLQPVPPTVKPSIFNVGWPTPTGTLWPSLPQVPCPPSMRMSLPIMLTRVSASGPLPMSVAPFTGCVTLPFSIR